MKKRFLFLFLAFILILSLCVGDPVSARAEASECTDTRFQGVYTTENIQAILDAYDLIDGWYWVTQAEVIQDFHGRENAPGWTDSTKKRLGSSMLETDGFFGCRWNLKQVNARLPNADGWGECFGFAQFIGYLLSGDRNPHGHWKAYYSVWEAKGLKPGDIVRVYYETEDGVRQHSAVVYEALDDQVIFIQVCGATYNKLSIRHGFIGGGMNTNNLYKIAKAPGLRIYRAPDNVEEE